MSCMIVIIAVIIISLFISGKKNAKEFDELLDLFDKSNNIIMINSKIDYYISTNYLRSKQSLIHTIINSLINKRRIDSMIKMKEMLITSNYNITMDIVENEIQIIENDISNYRTNLYMKLNAISQLENIYTIDI